MTKKMKGFTLIELLIVVAIIGIIAAVALQEVVEGVAEQGVGVAVADQARKAQGLEVQAEFMGLRA